MLNFTREHFRDYPYRTPASHRGAEVSGTALYRRFLRDYLWPNRWSLLLSILLVAINANYSYVISYLNRVAVDSILVVGGESDVAPVESETVRLTARDHTPVARNPPTVGAGRRIGQGVRFTNRPAEAGRKLFFLAVIYICTQFAFNYLSRWAARRQISVNQSILGKLREDLHQKVLDLSLSYHHRLGTGRLLSRIMSDTAAAKNALNEVINVGTRGVSMLVGGVAILLIGDWRILVLLGMCVPVFMALCKKTRPEVQRLQIEQRQTNSCIYGLVSQKMDAVKAVQSYGREHGELLAFHRLSSAYLRDAVRVEWYFMVTNFWTWLIVHLVNCVIFLYGGYLVLQGKMSLGKMLFLQSTANLLFQPVTDFTQLSFILQRLQVALGRCFGVLDEPIEITEDPSAVPFPSPIRQGVAIEHLSFQYPSGSEASLTPEERERNRNRSSLVLSDVSLFVPAGQWLCIMGASGSGKTTLLHLLARLYTPTAGTIRFDGVDLQKIQFASLREKLGVVPQEAQIFSGSMRDNIAYGYPRATNQQILNAAAAAQMHDFIMEMPVQYETLIGEKGQSLSGGQRQRLSLARALLTNPEVLLLDDCTSALDANTERRIQETLAKELAGKTAIMVSQRISMAVRCHQIAVLADGHVAELGTHQELLERNGFYAKLFREQTE
ncbi:MAG: ABC transporter ATP-binding protein [Victivallales bacterium]|nr:ABC transporter ATP-binding protein [Victivallales bacterium]